MSRSQIVARTPALLPVACPGGAAVRACAVGVRLLCALGAALAAGVLAPPAQAQAGTGPQVTVVVRQAPGAGDAPRERVRRLGGTPGRRIGVVDGFLARLPAARLPDLRSAPGVAAVTEDARVHLRGYDGFDPERDLGSVQQITQAMTGAGAFWDAGFTGRGVDVAVVDSGVADVDGLRGADKVLHGPDLSFESQSGATRYVDTFGHGTHMAAVIAGRDDATPRPVRSGVEDHFVGVAPDARLVSVKVADARGATDVSQVLAAIDWVVEHRRDPGVNIRVLNLSFGTDGVQDYQLDPLAYAVEVAWRRGIVVVVAAGNRGDGSHALSSPAHDPRVLAVGASDPRGTRTVEDDLVAPFSSHGDERRAPDLLAPGTSVVSLRAPGSTIDAENPLARVGTRQLRGSGTSQAAAVVSGAAALLVSQRPDITPDQVKAVLRDTARELPDADPRGQGEGLLDLRAALKAPTPRWAQQAHPLATGTGSLEASRGSGHLVDAAGEELRGELDVLGAPFSSAQWAPASLAGSAWSGGTWNGGTWAGDGWSSNRWSSATWSSNRWSGEAWSSNRWSSNRWSSNRWSAARWGR